MFSLSRFYPLLLPALGAVALLSQPLVAQTAIKINFQPLTSPVPAGYIPDGGEAFSDARGFGWVQEDSLANPVHTPLSLIPNARDRNRPGVDARLNTFIHMQYPPTVANDTAVKTPGAWEIALPNGTYDVTVSVGDEPTSGTTYDSMNNIRVEGVSAIERFQGVATKEYQQATVQTTVNDGRLTVDAQGGSNTKINYLEITSATPGVPPTPPPTPAPAPTPTPTPAPAPTPVASLPRARTVSSTFAPGNWILVAGGRTTYTQPLYDVSVYDPNSDAWYILAALPRMRGMTHLPANRLSTS
ncbi:kelch repeat-containing protein [Anthocerotibacter panamensis]|uniref:kelch repeat-containing protein n=1 Tax=Anthocerotibacter panamensis TaxID=2857077 RepID=UPI001C406FE0|nr:kelch repeat-containing protein [Anthocerotibacter panamensis]